MVALSPLRRQNSPEHWASPKGLVSLKGSESREVLEELGCSIDEIETLYRNNIVE
jgi:hypothetical protein